MLKLSSIYGVSNVEETLRTLYKIKNSRTMKTSKTTLATEITGNCVEITKFRCREVSGKEEIR